MKTKRPNFVFILTDDQGPWAVPWKMPELYMPNLQELAEEGTVFDNFYCASPVCSPARASILTGRMPSAHGIHDWLVGTRSPEAYPDKYLDDLVTLPAVLAGAGYRCGMSGKWHVGEAREPAPGFTHWYAHRYGGGPYYNAPIWKDGQEAEEPDYLTDAIADHAVAFLEQVSDQPFFLEIATTAPHDPWDGDNHPDELLDLYADCDFPSVPREPRHPWTQPRKKDFEHAFTDPKTSLRGYCAALSGVDRLIGRVRKTLENRGLAEHTIIFYMADNGFSCGHHGVWGKGNGTYPLNFWENSIRVPFVAYVPPQLRDSEQPAFVDSHVSAVSFFPTVCELAGVEPPVDPLRAGASLTGYLDDQSPDPEPVIVYDEYGGGRMIRSGRWKYVTRFDGPTELYDLDTDPHEHDNRANDPKLAEIRDDLHRTLNEWFARHETPLHRAFEQPVAGYGQIHPTWRRDQERRYAGPGQTLDGVRERDGSH